MLLTLFVAGLKPCASTELRMSTELTEDRGAAECMFVIPRPRHGVPTDLPCVNPRSFVCHHGSLAVRWKGTASSRANSGANRPALAPVARLMFAYRVVWFLKRQQAVRIAS